MPVKQRSWSESAIRPRNHAFMTSATTIWWASFTEERLQALMYYAQLAWAYLEGSSFTDIVRWLTSSYQRGIHDIRRPFAFRTNPEFIFHDSPGFEAGDEKQLQEVLAFIEEKAKSTEVHDQLHAIWLVSHLLSELLLTPLSVKVLFRDR